ncbi:RmlC-like cupin domain superfamily [Sesbania bispinosa]|nr:RmlC-like cupin domain superfamily [Sesbania bispinosa]
MNANSMMYVTRGRGRVEVVNCQGKSVFNGEVRKGQMLVVPQNFVVVKQAGSEGLEYIVFKTKDKAQISTLVGLNSTISSTPTELGRAFGDQRNYTMGVAELNYVMRIGVAKTQLYAVKEIAEKGLR